MVTQWLVSVESTRTLATYCCVEICCDPRSNIELAHSEQKSGDECMGAHSGDFSKTMTAIQRTSDLFPFQWWADMGMLGI